MPRTNRSNQPITVRDAITAALHTAASFHPDAETAPLAVLWPDGASQWQHIVPQLRESLPILTLGPFDPASQTGPAIWIRAELVKHTGSDTIPIIYLPGIRKEVFRNVEDAPPEIQPLLYLQYRGCMFLQPNSKDWTLAAFFQNAQHGLGVKVDSSDITKTALLGASRTLLHRNIAELRNHPGGIDSDYLSSLLISDTPRYILEWINDPTTTRGALDDATWHAFSQQLRSKYKIDPERDGPSEAASQLGRAGVGSYWIDVWNRFAESPHRYPAIPDMLRGAKPAETMQRDLFGSATTNLHWPQDNEEQEDALRQSLIQIDTTSAAAARTAILELESAHAPRRESVWAKLQQAPLAFALEHLAHIVRETSVAPPAGSVPTMQNYYTSTGWTIDAAALSALSSVTAAGDRTAIESALHAIYTPWLWTTAQHFQQAVLNQPTPAAVKPLTVPPGTCVLFADGLRYDLAARLNTSLTAKGFTAEISSTIGPIPGVTPSAKPAQSPIADLVQPGAKLNVNVAATGSPLAQPAFKKLLADKSWMFLTPAETGTPDAQARGWTELGNIDSYGHSHAQDLPRQSMRECEALLARIENLLTAGWHRVVVITDHGWLLTPQPMPKTDLPQHLTVERKGRCARLEPGATTSLPVVPWCWDPSVDIAMAPGISCFEGGIRYDHGGLSLQECVVPTIFVAPKRQSQAAASIESLTWRGLRCTIALQGAMPGLTIDIRQRAADASTSLAANTQATGENGKASLLIPDDAYEGTPAIVVVLDETGKTIAQRATIIGGDA